MTRPPSCRGCSHLRPRRIRAVGIERSTLEDAYFQHVAAPHAGSRRYRYERAAAWSALFGARHPRHRARSRSQLYSSIFTPLLFLVFLGNGVSDGLVAARSSAPATSPPTSSPGSVVMTIRVLVDLLQRLVLPRPRHRHPAHVPVVAALARASILFGKSLAGVVIGSVQALVVFAGSGAVRRLRLAVRRHPGRPHRLATIVLLNVMLGGLAQVLASRIQTMQGFHLMMNLALFPLLFFSGAFFPVDNLPMWLEGAGGRRTRSRTPSTRSNWPPTRRQSAASSGSRRFPRCSWRWRRRLRWWAHARTAGHLVGGLTGTGAGPSATLAGSNSPKPPTPKPAAAPGVLVRPGRDSAWWASRTLADSEWHGYRRRARRTTTKRGSSRSPSCLFASVSRVRLRRARPSPAWRPRRTRRAASLRGRQGPCDPGRCQRP